MDSTMVDIWSGTPALQLHLTLSMEESARDLWDARCLQLIQPSLPCQHAKGRKMKRIIYLFSKFLIV